jgi:hypothetical protein
LYFLSAYGFSFKSEIDLPGFKEIQRCEADVLVTLGTNSWEGGITETFSIHKLENGLRIDWPKVASYKIERGSSIVISPHPNSQPELTRLPLYGIAMAAILQQNNLLLLHGSSVEINKKALVLVGKKGAGKSTLTACLLARKNFLLSDDVTAIALDYESIPIVLPGIPCLRLWEDALNTMGIPPDSVPLLPYGIPKHNLDVSQQFINKQAPLQTIIMLEHGDTIALQKMTESEKMIWLLGGQYFAKFHEALPRTTHRHTFKQCSYIATKTDILRLTVPRDINVLPAVTDLLEEYLA